MYNFTKLLLGIAFEKGGYSMIEIVDNDQKCGPDIMLSIFTRI